MHIHIRVKQNLINRLIVYRYKDDKRLDWDVYRYENVR